MTKVMALKCKHIQDMAFDYLTGELSADKASAVEAHLAACELCRTEFDAVNHTLKALAEPKTMFAPPDVLDTVKSVIRHTKPCMVRARLGWTAAATVLLLFAGWAGIIRNANWRMNSGQVVTARPGIESARQSSGVLASGSTAETNAQRTMAAGNITKSIEGHRVSLRTNVVRRKERQPDRLEVANTPQHKVQPSGNFGQSLVGPTIEYVVVYAPDTTDNTRQSLSKDVEDGYRIGSVETSAYSIQMTDTQSSSVTTLSVQTTVEHDGKPSIAMNLGVTGTDEGTDGSERSPSDDGS